MAKFSKNQPTSDSAYCGYRLGTTEKWALCCWEFKMQGKQRCREHETFDPNTEVAEWLANQGDK